MSSKEEYITISALQIATKRTQMIKKKHILKKLRYRLGEILNKIVTAMKQCIIFR